MSGFKRWDVWWARVAYEDDPSKSDMRPVVIYAENKSFILSLKGTTTPPRKNYPGECVLEKWKEAGLPKETTIRTNKRLELIESDFIKKRRNIKKKGRREMKREEIADMLKRILAEIVEAAEKSDDPETLARLGVAAERLGNTLTFHYSD